MIEIQNLTKSYRIEGGRHYVFRDVSALFPEDANIGIIGPNGGGKSTFLRLLGGIDHPDSGRILCNKSFSWPLGLKGGFVGHLSGRENCRMICNLYGLPSRIMKRKLEEIKELSGIGKYFEEPVDYYSSGMGARLGFALSMSFDFDYFLIDEITSVGDANFRALAKRSLEEKAKRSRVIMVSHNMGDLKKFCDVAVLVSGGRFQLFENLDEAIRAYLPQGHEAAGQSDDVIEQASIEQLNLDSVALPPAISDHLHDIESALDSIQQKLAHPTHVLPSDEAAFFHQLGSVYEGLGDRVKARSYFERAAENNAYHLDTQLKLIEIAVRDGDQPLLSRALEAAVTAAPRNLRVLLHRIRHKLRSGDPVEALSLSAEALRLFPGRADLWRLRSEALERLERLPEALEAQIKAVKYDPKSAFHYLQLSALLASNGDQKKAQLATHKARLLRAAPIPSPAPPSLEKLSATLRKLDTSLTS